MAPLLEGLTPLEYMLTLLRDIGSPPEIRRWAAEHAAPYIHPRLAAMTHTGPNNGPIQYQITDQPIMTDDEWAAEHVTEH